MLEDLHSPLISSLPPHSTLASHYLKLLTYCWAFLPMGAQLCPGLSFGPKSPWWLDGLYVFTENGLRSTLHTGINMCVNWCILQQSPKPAAETTSILIPPKLTRLRLFFSNILAVPSLSLTGNRGSSTPVSFCLYSKSGCQYIKMLKWKYKLQKSWQKKYSTIFSQTWNLVIIFSALEKK